MTAGDLAGCWIAGGHRPPLQFGSRSERVPFATNFRFAINRPARLLQPSTFPFEIWFGYTVCP